MSAFIRFRRLTSLLLAALSLTSMGAKARPKRPLVIAHRGASHDAPENTLAAFHLAWKQGADGCEGDFYLTADGKIVCIHDADTKRTAGANLRVADSTLAELQQLDVGSWKSSEFAAERIPTLQEVLQTVPPGKLFYIEIKCGPEIVPPLAELLRAQQSVTFEQLRIISFNAEVISAAKQQLPAIKAFWLTRYEEAQPSAEAANGAATNSYRPTLESILETLARTRADGLGSSADLNVLNAPFAEALQAAGKELHVWTVDDAEKARQLHDIGALSITTNLPAVMCGVWPKEGDSAAAPSANEQAERFEACPPAAGYGNSGCASPPRRRLFPRLFGRRW